MDTHKVADGRYYIRVGSINREMSTSELARLFQQRQLVFFEETPVNGTSIRDLDTELLRDYFLMNNGFDLDELAYEERNNILFNMENIRYMDRLGRGIPMILREMKQLGRREPLLEESDEEFVLILYL